MKSLTKRALPVAPGFRPHRGASAASLPFDRHRLFALLCAAIALCAVLCVVPGAALAVPAANEPAVVYDAAAHEWHGENLQPENVMVDFADVMPGDTLVQEFTVRADNVQNPVSIFMRRDVPDAPANARAEAAGPLDAVRYTATAGGKVVSQGALGDLLDGNAPLAQFSADGALDCRIALEVPTSYGNKFQTAAYTLEWLFIAQEDGGPEEGGGTSGGGDADGGTGGENGGGASGGDSAAGGGNADGGSGGSETGGVTASSNDLFAKTGDDSMGLMMPLACAATVATVLIIVALLMRRRQAE